MSNHGRIGGGPSESVRPVPGYQSGFGNHFSTEALPGALPQGRNSPQRTPYGLYAELLSGSAFTAPRAENRRTWVYRIRPSAANLDFKRIDNGLIRTAPFNETAATPAPLRWDPFPFPDQPSDFIEAMLTIAGNGDAGMQAGIGIHVYTASRSMNRRVFCNADGEMLLVPQAGRLHIATELGALEVSPLEIAIIPRGLRFRVDLPEGAARGYVCENYGPMLRLPELGPIGSNGLAAARDFLAPVAACEERDEPHEIVTKFAGNLWSTRVDHSPLDVVAWHGNLVPYKYDLTRFMVIGTVSFDHPDPSIFTVLTSPSAAPGTANVDFVIFPPRWMVGENTFRPPWFHRNVMSEYMGLIQGQYDAKADGFVPGGGSLHNSWTAHGPDAETFEHASRADLRPHKIENTMAFMFETRYPILPTRFAMQAPERQHDYSRCWQGLQRHFTGKP